VGQPPAGHQPADPFQQTTNTPASAQLPQVDPNQPYPVSAQPYPVSSQPYSAQPYSGQPYPGQPYPGQPYPGQPYPGQPFPGAPMAPPKKKSKALLITGIVLGVLALLCAAGGVGAFFLLRGGEGKGAATAKEAADGFLTAIYKDGEPADATKLVCKEARDEKAITSKVNEVKDQKSKLQSPTITWSSVDVKNETAESADTTVTLKLTTTDEKISEQTLKLQLVKRDGWFVCEVQEQTK
jgi:flagellar basal body-associated protein FliL